MGAIEVNTNFDFKKIGDGALNSIERDLGIIMQDLVSDIKIRTDQGRDADGAGFKPFSDSYAKRLKKLGRSTRPTLRFSGQMIDSIQSKIERTANAIIGIIYALPGRVNRYGNATNTDLIRYNNETRNFFALSTQQIQNLINKLRGK